MSDDHGHGHMPAPFDSGSILARRYENEYAAMAALGTCSADLIAAIFVSLRINGSRGDHCGCPIAKWVALVCGAEIAIGPLSWAPAADVADRTPPVPPSPAAGGHPLPETCRAFVTWFDHGMYPALIAASNLISDPPPANPQRPGVGG